MPRLGIGWGINMKIVACPEGHICDSDCQDKKECPCNEHRHTILSELGRSGGIVKSEAKTEAARTNGKKGGRPKKEE